MPNYTKTKRVVSRKAREMAKNAPLRTGTSIRKKSARQPMAGGVKGMTK